MAVLDLQSQMSEQIANDSNFTYDEGDEVTVTVFIIVVAGAVTVGAKYEAQSADPRAVIAVFLTALRQLSALQVNKALCTPCMAPRAMRRMLLLILTIVRYGLLCKLRLYK